MANLFESVSCGRCGGSGQYSYCTMHGTRCFGCGGSGQKLTKRGRAAQDFFTAMRVVPFADIKVGDWILADCFFQGRFNAEVVSIEGDTVQLRELPRKDGATLRKMAMAGFQTFHRVFTVGQRRENAAKALAYQATLTKSGTPRKVTHTKTGAVDNA